MLNLNQGATQCSLFHNFKQRDDQFLQHQVNPQWNSQQIAHESLAFSTMFWVCSLEMIIQQAWENNLGTRVQFNNNLGNHQRIVQWFCTVNEERKGRVSLFLTDIYFNVEAKSAIMHVRIANLVGGYVKTFKGKWY